MTNSNVDATQDMIIEGYAILFDSMSEDLGGFREIINPNALNDVDVSDVKCLINHDFNYVIGRTQSGTLELTIDNKGLYFKCFLPNTSYARDIYENIKAGNVNQCSFFYTLPPDDQNARTWQIIDGEYVQTINTIDELIEVSIVTVPAYQDTSVEVAQRNKGFKEFKEKQKIQIALELESLHLDM
ncbi:HK97 family phage prohead protease [Staphylococcus caprae]|uniref:HK97 family phage prohead protease n=1 Tax=Staphylococcus caprae TaxID=29380 RepID=UPI001C8360B5|nr:HK97 family phage prohead protease [Staphylococcus caprae]MBX5315962.1 HK97 family phage prohead protease [Staphylococcus caprae]